MQATKQDIRQKISSLANGNLKENALEFFKALGYQSPKTTEVGKTAQEFAETFEKEEIFRADKALANEWKQIELLFQLSEVDLVNEGDFSVESVDPAQYQSYLFFALELKGDHYNRTQLSQITREINRIFLMPALILFKYNNKLTLSIIDRRPNKRQSSKDVVHKVTLIKDINIESPHRAHIDILEDLNLSQLMSRHKVSNFNDLHEGWKKVLSTSELNKKFYREISDWYFWAHQHVSFPDDVLKNAETRNATNLIRLITRVIFVWFIKEKGLVPEKLFDETYMQEILNGFDVSEGKDSVYFAAILQNLFFGTLNQQIDRREFAKDEGYPKNKNKYGVKNLFRYEHFFDISEEEAIKLFEDIPFLNGGLFDCLDKEDEKKKVQYVDGFSRNPDKQALVPDFLFFGERTSIDLQDYYGTGRQFKNREVAGLIHILKRYKFTVEENTPLEEDIALDPELLGKVFENLLASYNPETKTTARKQTGSYYTPREIVDYMVDESLTAYLSEKSKVKQEVIKQLLSWEEDIPELTDQEQTSLVNALDNIKILDPACGSGAFPMGALHKMVHLLNKLDPDNEQWKEKQVERVKKLKSDAENIQDANLRDEILKDLDKTIESIEDAFKNNDLDYGRKLYLIENCLYGVDIQPVAVQISKLRFFISMVVDQKVDKRADNYGIRALPNLETKFVAANTLIGLKKAEGGDQLSIIDFDVDKLKIELKKVRHHYFNAKTRKDKLRYQDQDKKLREQISKKLIDNGWNVEDAHSIAQWDPYDQNAAADWFDPEWMFGMKDGFDVVIGNPPYVQLQKSNGQLAQLYKNKGYETFQRTGDIYALFYENSYYLLKQDGISCFITSNKWMRAGYGASLRKFLAEKTNPLHLIDFSGNKIFESATVDTNILIFKKGENTQETKTCAIKERFSDLRLYVKDNALSYRFSPSESWVPLSPIEQSIKEKIEKAGTPLKDWDININRGILTGCNEAFIIDGQKKEELIAQDPKSAEIIRPILRGRDIKRYGYDFADLWLINAHNGIKGKGEKRVNINDYTAIKAHLDRYYDKLEKRDDKGDTPYNLRNCAYMEDFYRQKIVWKSVGRNLTFALLEEGYFVTAPASFLTSPCNLYILGFLCSSLTKYFVYNNSDTTGAGDIMLNIQSLSKLPMPLLSYKEQKQVNEIVRIIIDLKSKGKGTFTKEKELDSFIYRLLEFNNREIDFIDSL